MRKDRKKSRSVVYSSYPLFIALRYLRSKKKHRGISFNTIISTAGVTLGVMALIIVLSVMSGFQDDLRNKILGVNAHVVVLNAGGFIDEYKKDIERLLKEEHIKGASPFVLGQVMLTHAGRAQGVYLRGVMPEYELKTTTIGSHMKEGSLMALAKTDKEPPPIVIGKELSMILNAYIGDVVTAISPVQELGPMGMLPRTKRFRVAGIFEVGMYEYDSSLALIPLREAQRFLSMGDAVTGIELRLDDIFLAGQVREDIPRILGKGYYGRDWMQMNRNLFSALKLEKFAMFIILILIILVASFNIISTLIMNVIEKEREIAILRAMGATSRGIMTVFVLQGIIIGIIGTILGVAGGVAICYLISNYEIIKLPADVYYLSHLPAKVNPWDVVSVAGAAILISFVSTIYPAYQAARLNPVEPLRYE